MHSLRLRFDSTSHLLCLLLTACVVQAFISSHIRKARDGLIQSVYLVTIHIPSTYHSSAGTTIASVLLLLLLRNTAPH